MARHLQRSVNSLRPLNERHSFLVYAVSVRRQPLCWCLSAGMTLEGGRTDELDSHGSTTSASVNPSQRAQSTGRGDEIAHLDSQDQKRASPSP